MPKGRGILCYDEMKDDGKVACDNCGKLVYERNLTLVGDKFLCQSCVHEIDEEENEEDSSEGRDDGKVACDNCGKLVYERNLTLVGDKFLCQSCVHEIDEDE